MLFNVRERNSWNVFATITKYHSFVIFRENSDFLMSWSYKRRSYLLCHNETNGLIYIHVWAFCNSKKNTHNTPYLISLRNLPFISRWITSCECKNSMPSSICFVYRCDSSSERTPLFFMWADNDPCRQEQDWINVSLIYSNDLHYHYQYSNPNGFHRV